MGDESMNTKQIVLSLVALDFAALTAYALVEMGLVGMWETLTSNIMTMTLGADLVIALSLGIWWMVRDGRRHGISPVPYVALTVCTGSLGLLLFLIKREGAMAKAPRGEAPQPLMA